MKSIKIAAICVALFLAATVGYTAFDSPGSFDAFRQAVEQGFTVKSGKHIVLPQDDDAATPSLAFGNGDSGFYEKTDNKIVLSSGGAERFAWAANIFGGTVVGSGCVYNQIATATSPTLVPYTGYHGTGIGVAASNQLSLIAGALEGQRILEANSKIYTAIGGVEADRETDGDTDGTTTITSNGATGDDFSTTCATGDMLFIYGGTTVADYGPYRIVTVTDNDNLVLDRAPSGTNSDVDFVIIKDCVLVENTDGTNGQRIVGCSHQDKPLQIGGDTLAATGHSLGAEDVLIGGKLEVDDDAYCDGDLAVAGNLTLAPTADPMFILDDSNFTGTGHCYVLDIDTDPGATTSNDLTEQLEIGDVATTVRHADADGDYEIGTAAMPVKIVGQLVLHSMTFAFTTEADMTDPLTASTILLDGDNDSDNDTIDLQDGETVGQIAHLVAAVDIDADDTVTINFGDTTCLNCAATVFDKVGENAMFKWVGGTAGWVQMSLEDSL